MFKSNAFLCFALFLVSIHYVYAESVAPLTESEITYDSKRRFTCGGYSLKGMISELDADNEIYKADTDTLFCTFGMVFQKCADGSRCKCPPAEWEENGCWMTYEKLRQKQYKNSRHFQESQRFNPSP